MKKLLILLIFTTCIVSLAQGSSEGVPDVTGLTPAQAAALLNKNGFNLGQQSPTNPVEGYATNTVVAQSIAPGTSAALGTAVDVFITSPTNARLVYNDNNITLFNLTDNVMRTANIVFRALDGSQASFNIAQLTGVLEARDCIQLWSVDRGDTKINGCHQVYGRTLTDPSQYFWSQTSGITQFAIIENGVQQATCPAAAAGTTDTPLYCDIYLAGGGVGYDETDYMYLVYSDNAMAIINTSETQWMRTDQTIFHNHNPGLSMQDVAGILGDTEVLREEHHVGLGSVTRLAPNQCIVFTVQGSGVNESPETCDVVAQRSLDGNVVVWLTDFEAESYFTGKMVTCPDSISGELVRCVAKQ